MYTCNYYQTRTMHACIPKVLRTSTFFQNDSFIWRDENVFHFCLLCLYELRKSRINIVFGFGRYFSWRADNERIFRNIKNVNEQNHSMQTNDSASRQILNISKGRSAFFGVRNGEILECTKKFAFVRCTNYFSCILAT